MSRPGTEGRRRNSSAMPPTGDEAVLGVQRLECGRELDALVGGDHGLECARQPARGRGGPRNLKQQNFSLLWRAGKRSLICRCLPRRLWRHCALRWLAVRTIFHALRPPTPRGSRGRGPRHGADRRDLRGANGNGKVAPHAARCAPGFIMRPTHAQQRRGASTARSATARVCAPLDRPCRTCCPCGMSWRPR